MCISFTLIPCLVLYASRQLTFFNFTDKPLNISEDLLFFSNVFINIREIMKI